MKLVTWWFSKSVAIQVHKSATPSYWFYFYYCFFGTKHTEKWQCGNPFSGSSGNVSILTQPGTFCLLILCFRLASVHPLRYWIAFPALSYGDCLNQQGQSLSHSRENPIRIQNMCPGKTVDSWHPSLRLSEIPSWYKSFLIYLVSAGIVVKLMQTLLMPLT